MQPATGNTQPSAKRCITLTTDFGLADPYVAIMHGVIAGLCPAARVIDVSHAVAAQDLRQAGLVLARAWPWFPPASVHVVVVDPGVGTERAILAARCAGHRFLVPDNGLLDLAVGDREVEAVHRVERDELYLKPVSSTFHGRDIFAPVAAAIAGGLRIEELGPAVSDWQREALPQPVATGGDLIGEVVYVDGFGNAVTNLPAARVPAAAQVQVGEHRPIALVESYAAVPAGAALAIVGSAGLLELSVNRGHAGRELGLVVGSAVRVVGAAG